MRYRAGIAEQKLDSEPALLIESMHPLNGVGDSAIVWCAIDFGSARAKSLDAGRTLDRSTKIPSASAGDFGIALCLE